MTIGIDVFMQDFTLEERAEVAARLAELVEAELSGRRFGLGGRRASWPASNQSQYKLHRRPEAAYSSIMINKGHGQPDAGRRR